MGSGPAGWDARGFAEAVGRGSGLAGLVLAAGGLLVLSSVVAPWWEAHAELALSGVAQGREVTSLEGWEHLAGIAGAAAGVVAAALGIALAIDRHPGWTRPAAMTAGAVAALAAAVGTWWQPSLGRFPDRGGSLGELRDVVDELPVDVELALTVVRGSGAVLAAIGAGLIVLGTAAARELDQR